MSLDIPRARIPTREVLENSLLAGGFLGLTPQTDRFFRSFAAQVAGRRLSGRQLDSAWTAAHETFGDTLRSVHQLTDMEFVPVMQAITSNVRVIEQAMQVRERRLRNQR